jgi:ABC-type transporter Mla maintaining outer membrane lipid asymmetry ATPase subunit MlaF
VFPLQNILCAIDEASKLRTRIIWLFGSSGTGKTRLLKQLAAQRPDCEYLNLNAALAERLKNDAPDQRPFTASQHLGVILSPRSAGAVLLDNIELLFSRHLRLPVVDRLKSIAQQTTLVVAWPGSLEIGKLTYGARNSGEFAEYPIETPLAIDLNNKNTQGQ